MVLQQPPQAMLQFVAPALEHGPGVLLDDRRGDFRAVEGLPGGPSVEPGLDVS